ncbi:hypothetical protein [Pelobium manganitolerans]|uniref:hypothetical protein n=1 Tax=Pelobium manganitolerans TaxID=1842495 RepID=UPI003FA3C972
MNQYNLKLTAQQAEALRDLLKEDMQVKTGNLAQKLLRVLMRKVYKRLRNHCEDKPDKAFGMMLSEEVEIAFYSYFKMYGFAPTEVYERGFIEAKMVEIDKRIC